MKKILIIDDSALMRRVLSDIITSDTRYCVEDTAANGLEGFDLITCGKEYDAVILDINMPKMNGIEFLEALEKHKIKTKVIVVSTLAKEGAKETIRCLELGAFDFVTKPESFYEVKSERFKAKIMKCLCTALKLDYVGMNEEIGSTRMDLAAAREKAEKLPRVTKRSLKSSSSNKNKVIALACSTGGPKALQSVIPLLPKNMDCSLIIVQHMPAGFTKSLAVRLNELSQITVKEAEEGDVLTNGVAYIAKGGAHLKVVTGKDGVNRLHLSDEPPRTGLRPCADILYESLVESDYDDITCVVLTGMGADGTRGIKTLKQKKEVYVIAQDEQTSTVYGMPKMVAVSGLVDEIQPLGLVADAMIKNVGVK